MNSTTLIILLALVGFSIVFLAYYFDNKQSIIRTLKKLPNKPISGLKTNQFTKVTGKAKNLEEPLIAPYSKRKCVFYKIKIEQKKRSGKNKYWSTIVNEEKIQAFFIEKNGDYVMVKSKQNPKNYKSYLVADKKTSSGIFNEPTPEFLAVLEKYNIKTQGFFGINKQIRYSEGIIEIGEEITVAGIGKWQSLKAPIANYSYSKIAALESTVDQKLIITDLPNISSKKSV